MLSSLDNAVLTQFQLRQLLNFKEAFNSDSTKNKAIGNLGYIVSQSKRTINEQNNIIQNLEYIVEEQQKTIQILQTESPSFQDQLALERILSGQPKIGKFFLPKIEQPLKRKIDQPLSFAERDQERSKMPKAQEHS